MEIVVGLLIFAGLAFYLIRKINEVDPPVTEQSKTEEPVVNIPPVAAPVVEEPKVVPVQPLGDTTSGGGPAIESEWPKVDTSSPKPKPRKYTRRPPAITATPKAKKPRAPKAT
jgi:hypothetical protein